MVAIADGDTLTLLDASNTQHKIRLAGIDAPERGQPFGAVSGDHLGKLVFSKQVTVDYDKRDRYGRMAATTEPQLICPHPGCLATVYVASSVDRWSAETPEAISNWYACPLHGAVEPVRVDEGAEQQ